MLCSEGIAMAGATPAVLRREEKGDHDSSWQLPCVLGQLGGLIQAWISQQG